MIKDEAIDTHKLIPENTTEEVISEAAEQSSSINDDLNFVFNDLKQQVANSSGDQLLRGVMKFCDRYKKLVRKRFAHNALASAFHKFGWVFGGTVSRQAGSLRHG